MTNPALLQSQLVRAQSLQQAGRKGEAWATIAPLRKAIDQHSQALRLYALIAQADGKIDQAAEALKRILTIERDPPEIVGALADMLGQAGRHDQALFQWSRLAALQPMIADAHLNRAIAAADAGKPLIAIEAADTGLKRFPGHARLMAVRAMALKNAGQLEQSIAAFAAAVAADPNRALTRHNQAVALRASYRFDEACEAFAASERLGMKGAEFYAEWAAAAVDSGQTGRATELYQSALAASPGHDEAMRALTRLHIVHRTGQDPFRHYAALAETARDDVDPWLRWADALAANRLYADAADVAARGMMHHPGHALLHTIRTFSAGMAGDAAGPAAELDARYRLDPQDRLVAGMLTQIGLRAGRPELAAEAAEQLLADDPQHQTAWAILSIAWRVLGDERERWLCDYDRLVMTVAVTPPGESLSAADYARRVADILRPLHTTLEAPGDQSLRHGTQTTGALFDNPDAAIQQFRDAVVGAAARSVATLPDDPNHPFLSRKQPEVRTNGSWSVRLRAGGGQHVPHFHSTGWMSSAYYAQLPQPAPKRDPQEGWIEFGRPPPIFNLDLEPRRLIKPQAGMLVLFPSYLWHGTVPFGAGERLTAAFDFQPVTNR